jgi:hypothetical protein
VFRIEYYKQFAWYLYVDYEDEELGCGKQKQFSAGGAGALPIYWDKVRPGISHVDHPDPDPDPDIELSQLIRIQEIQSDPTLEGA